MPPLDWSQLVQALADIIEPHAIVQVPVAQAGTRKPRKQRIPRPTNQNQKKAS